MPRAGQVKPPVEERLSDRIALGVLTRVFPAELVDEVVAEGTAKQMSLQMDLLVAIRDLFVAAGPEKQASLLVDPAKILATAGARLMPPHTLTAATPRRGTVEDTGTYPYPGGVNGGNPAVADANIRIPAEARDRLAEVAAAEGMSLRAYLARLADTLLTPAERAERAEAARAALRSWNGYDPTNEEQAAADAELDRRLTQAAAR